MIDLLLITRDDIDTFYSMGKNLDEGRINPHIRRAQQNDLKPILGEYLYWDIVNFPDTAANKRLLDGGAYDPKGLGGEGIGRVICDQIIVCDDIIDCEIHGGI